MKKFISALAVFAALFLLNAAPMPAHAQNGASVVTACGSLSIPVGYAQAPLVMDVTGKLCANTGSSFYSANFTRPNNTSCCSAAQMIANATLAASVVPMTFTVGHTIGSIWGAKVKSSNTGIAGASVTLSLYTASPTIASGDGATFSTSESGWFCDLVIPLNGLSFTDATDGYGIPGTSANCPVPTDVTTLYGLVRANSTFTAAANGVWTFTINGQ